MNNFMKSVSWYLIVAMFIIGIAPKVDAAFSPSEQIALAQFDRNADLQKVRSFLESKMVRDRLAKLGYTQEEIQSKLNQLSDQQIHQFALNLDQLKVGGDDALGVIIALLVIALLVVLILQLTGHRVIVR